MGINSSTNSSGIMGVANDAYLYNLGQNLLIGTGSSSKSLIFMTGGTTQSANERMRVDGSGNVGIGVIPSYKLHVVGTNPLFLSGVQTGAASDSVLTISNGLVKKLSAAGLGNWSTLGNAGTNPATNFLGTTDAQGLSFRVNNAQVARFESTSTAIGLTATTNNSSNSYAMGSGATIGFNQPNSFAIGNNSAINGDNSFAIGNSAISNADNAFSIGNGANANSVASIALGASASIAYSISDAVSIGTNAHASANNAVAIGSNTSAAARTTSNGISSIAIGTSAVVNSPNSMAIGTLADVAFSISGANAIGNAASVDGTNGIAIGTSAATGFAANASAFGALSSVSGANSTAIGYKAAATLANTIVLGEKANTAVSVGIGSENFNGSNREKLLVDAGTTTSYNVISGKGSINNYLQLNIQNQSNGTAASSDIVATADNGSETANFIDMGINSSSYPTTGVLGGANTAYLYATGNDFVIGNGGNNKSLIFYTTFANTGTERMRVTNAGLLPGADNAYTLGANGTRWSAVWSANGVIQTSDARLKKDIVALPYGLKEVMQMQPVKYNWIDNSPGNKIGLLAQEVKKIVPEVVAGDETKENLGMNYAELVPVLINAIKELKADLELAKKEIENLKKTK
ncbi:MAG: tail fiber domain-containing protein [Gemmatimonadaceae bacterium]|nr:tail fiber domain-containing protein [Chitinophagaceae bacterium]